MNPYEVLGIPQGTPPEKINAAYKAKLSEINRPGNGLTQEEYQRRLDEINSAYDQLMFSGGGNARASSSTSSAVIFGDVRAKIKEGRIDDAETILDGIPAENRNAEWYYLKGQIQHKRGWLEEAVNNFRRAVNMDPNNFEYENALSSAESKQRGSFREERRNRGGNMADNCYCVPGCGCDICSSLLCADCLCSMCDNC